jgi:serine/threonine protein kinase
LSHESVFQIGLQLLDILEMIHNAGYIYNDLKLDNILLGYEQKLPADCTQGNCVSKISINLVDFGFSTRYIDEKTGKHMGSETEDYFRGNLLFASKYHLHFRKTSRRDDIIGLYYLMIFLLNHGDLPGFDWNKAS